MELKKVKNFKWLISFLVMIFFCVSMLPISEITAKADTQTGVIRNADGTVTISVAYEGNELYLAGSMTSWDSGQLKMTKDSNGIFSVTTGVLEPGNYEYKFKPNSNNWDGAFNQEKDGSNNNSSFTIKALGTTLNGDGTATFRVKYNGDKLYLVGSMNNWTKAIPMTKGTDGVFETTINVESGTTYQYKYKVTDDMSDWTTGSFNQANDGTDANSTLKVPGEAKAYAPVLNGDGTVTFTYKDLSAKSVVVAGPFGDGATWSATALQMKQDEETGLWSLTLNPSKLNGNVDGDKIQYKFVVDGKTWVTDPNNEEFDSGNSVFTYYTFNKAMKPVLNPDGTVIFSYDDNAATNVNVFGDFNSWNKDDTPLTKNNAGIWTAKISPLDGATSVTYKFIVDGTNYVADPNGLDTVSDGFGGNNSVFNLSGQVQESKKVIVKYVRDDKDYSGWTFYTWSTGKKDGDYEFTEKDGAAYAEIPVGNNTSSIGFKIRKDGLWDAAHVDYDADRSISIDKDSMVTKVTVYSGKGDIFVVPSVNEAVINNGQIDFKYRDKDLYEQNAQDKINSVKLMIKYEKGSYETINMPYDSLNEYFSTSYKNLKEGTYTYKFVESVKDGDDVETEEKTITYKKRDISAKASVTPSSINYNQNAVVTVNLKGKDINTDNIKAIYMDLTELGQGSKNSIALGNLVNGVVKKTISVTDSTSCGIKTIPITVVDANSEEHKTSTTITITPYVSTGDKLDFGFDEARIYFAVTDRFNNGNIDNDDPNGNNYDKTAAHTYHGGDFAGLTAKIPYLADLGINTLWITPIVEQTDFDQLLDEADTQYSYHGYWAKNFTKIDPHLGSQEDLDKLIDTAHEYGIKLMVDVVLNHAGYGMDKASSDYAGFNNYPTDEDRNVFKLDDGSSMFRDKDGDSDWTSSANNGQLPDFRTEDIKVRTTIINWQTAWMEHKTNKGNSIDYYRVDTVKHVDDDTWQAFKTALTEINPEFKMIGEYYGANYQSDGNQLENGQMDSVLDFSYQKYATNFVNGQITSTEASLDDRAAKMSNTYLLGQFLSSHDQDGFLTQVDGDTTDEITDEDRAKQLVAASLQITDKGMPVIYYGEEVGLTGTASFQDGEKNRYDMNFDLVNTDENANRMYNHYKKLLAIRDKYSMLFAKGDRTTIDASDEDGYSVYSRTYKGKEVMTALNINYDEDLELTISMPTEKGKTITDLYSGKTYTVDENGDVEIIVPCAMEGGTAIFAFEDEVNTDSVKKNAVVSNDGKVSTDVLSKFEGSQEYVPVVNVNGNAQVKINNVNGLVKKLKEQNLDKFEITITSPIDNEKALAKIDKNTIVGEYKITSNLANGELGTSIDITLNVGDSYNGKTLYMYYVNNGKLELIKEGKVENGCFTFATTHLSDYVLLNKKLGSNNSTSTITNNSNTNSITTTTTNTKNINKSNSAKSSKTSDANNFAYVFACLFAAASIFGFRKKAKL